MKTIRWKIFLCALLGVWTLMGSCQHGSNQTASNYNYEFVVLMNTNAMNVESMNDALTTGNYLKAETIRKDWKKDLRIALHKATSMTDFRNDRELKTAVINGLKKYQNIVAVDYKKLISIRRENDSTLQKEENQLLKNINRAFSKANNKMSNAESAFKLKYVN